MKSSIYRSLSLTLALVLIFSLAYGLVLAEQPNFGFQAFLPFIEKNESHSISGQIVTEDGIPVPGVSILTSDGHQAVSDSLGAYTLTSLPGTEYRLIPSKEGYAFSPATVLVNVPPNISHLNFTSSLVSCSDIIVNGGFEDSSAWELPITEYTAAYSTALAHQGTRSLRTGIVNTIENRYSYSSGRQTVTIPSGIASANLIFYIFPQSSETTAVLPEMPASAFGESPLAGDVQYVLITDLAGNILDRPIWQISSAGAWQGYSFDVTRFAGRTVQVHFGTYNDGAGGITSMYVDDVALQLCPSTSPTPTPIPSSCGNLIVNDGFETTGGWEIPLTAYSASYSSARAHTGVRSMRTGITDLGSNKYSYSDARQTVYIPSNAQIATLGMWIFQSSGEVLTSPLPAIPTMERIGDAPLSSDVQYVLILDQYEYIIETLLWQRSNAQNWTYVEFDLQRYAGRVIKIQFGTYNDGWDGITSMYVDDVQLNTCFGTPTATSSIPTATPTNTPIPANTPTPTSTPAACTEIIVNGGLESSTAWEIPITVYPAAYSTDRSHSGLRSMRTGITNPLSNVFSYSDARQTITIPWNVISAKLTFFTYTYSGESPSLPLPALPAMGSFGDAPLASDVQYLLILNQYGTWIDTLLWQRNNTQAWVGYTFDLKPYAGQTISLQYGTYNDGLYGITYMYYDDVSLQVCTP